MGFPIPEPFCWDESFAVFYELLDEEHKQLFKCVFDVAADKASADALAKLVSVTKNHFGDEEGMMKKANYANFDSHHKIHEEFVAKISALKAPVDDATVNFAKDWLVNHIKTIDFVYKGKL